MLTETIKNSVRTMERLRRHRENRAAAAQFSIALAKLSEYVTKAQRTLDCAEEMRACHVSEGPVLTKAVLDELRDTVSDCGNAVNDASLNVDKVGLLELRVKAAQRELDNAWKQCAPALVEPLKSRLSILRGLSKSKEEGARIQELERRIQSALDSPVTRERIRSFAIDIQEAGRSVDRLPLEADIEAFLQKVSLGRATLADLTPEIREWLRKYQFEGKFRIVSP